MVTRSVSRHAKMDLDSRLATASTAVSAPPAERTRREAPLPQQPTEDPYSELVAVAAVPLAFEELTEEQKQWSYLHYSAKVPPPPSPKKIFLSPVYPNLHIL